MHYEGMVNQIYKHEQQLNKPNAKDTKTSQSISKGFGSSKYYDKQEDFEFSLFPVVPHMFSFHYWLSVQLLSYIYAQNKCKRAKLL